jgi:hypothetical protein
MIQSEEFPPYDLQKEFWTLRLYPKGYQHLSTDDDSTTQLYLTLCPSHISSRNSSTSIQIHFRALINFSNLQVKNILYIEESNQIFRVEYYIRKRFIIVVEI